MRLLLDEMFPSDAARRLQEGFGHDAVHVDDFGRRGADDQQVAEVARAEGRAVVTENVADDAAERALALVCVLERNPLAEVRKRARSRRSSTAGTRTISARTSGSTGPVR